MNRSLLFIIILVPFLLSPGLAPAGGDEILVISMKKKNEKISEKLLRRIYLKRKILWENSTRIVPVNLPAESPLRRAFTGSIVRLSHRDLVDYWNAEYFKGVRPPEVAGSEEAVKRFVRQVEGAIGYISSQNMEPDLTVLYRIKSNL